MLTTANVEDQFQEYLNSFGSTWLIGYTLGSIGVAVILGLILLRFSSRELNESIAFLKELQND